MRKKILLFEPDPLLKKTLLEQLSLNKDLEINYSDNFEDVQCKLKKSSFDLLIMGTDREAFCLSSIGRFIKENKITNIVLFMITPGTKGASSLGESKENHYFIEKPFRIQHLSKKISIILAKISNSNEMIHKIGPFMFFPLKKIMMLGDKKKVDLTEKEVDILKCLIGSGKEIVDKDKLLKQVWNYSSDVTTHTLETHIYRLRQKLEIDSSIPRLIISEGGGFTIRSV